MNLRLGVVTLGVAVGVFGMGQAAMATEPPPALSVPANLDLGALIAKAPELAKIPTVKAALDGLLALPAVTKFQKYPPIFDLKGGLTKLAADPEVAKALQALASLPEVQAAIGGATTPAATVPVVPVLSGTAVAPVAAVVAPVTR